MNLRQLINFIASDIWLLEASGKQSQNLANFKATPKWNELSHGKNFMFGTYVPSFNNITKETG